MLWTYVCSLRERLHTVPKRLHVNAMDTCLLQEEILNVSMDEIYWFRNLFT